MPTEAVLWPHSCVWQCWWLTALVLPPGNTSTPLLQWSRLCDGNLGLCPGSAYASHCHHGPQTCPLASSGPAFPLEPNAAPLSQRLVPGTEGQEWLQPPSTQRHRGRRRRLESRGAEGSGPEGLLRVLPVGHLTLHPGCHQRPLESWASRVCPADSARWQLGQSRGDFGRGCFWRPLSLTRCPAPSASNHLLWPTSWVIPQPHEC